MYLVSSGLLSSQPHPHHHPHRPSLAKSERTEKWSSNSLLQVEFQSRDLEFQSRDLEFQSRDLEFQSRDLEFQSRDLEFQSRDLKFQSRDLEFKDCYGMALIELRTFLILN